MKDKAMHVAEDEGSLDLSTEEANHIFDNLDRFEGVLAKYEDKLLMRVVFMGVDLSHVVVFVLPNWFIYIVTACASYIASRVYNRRPHV